MFTEEQVDSWFTFYTINDNQRERSEIIRHHFKLLARTVLKNTRPGADQTAALRHMRDACMTLNNAIALEVTQA